MSKTSCCRWQRKKLCYPILQRSQLPNIGSFFIRDSESFLTERLKSLTMTLIFVSPLFTDQFNESTCMHLGHGQWSTGLVVNHLQMTKWVLSLTTCRVVCYILNKMSDNNDELVAIMLCLITLYSLCILVIPWIPTSIHMENYLIDCKMSWCELSHGDVNAHNSLEFGQTIVKYLRKSWYSGFYDKLSKLVVIIEETRRTWWQYVV